MAAWRRAAQARQGSARLTRHGHKADLAHIELTGGMGSSAAHLGERRSLFGPPFKRRIGLGQRQARGELASDARTWVSAAGLTGLAR
jgi:hypothetical protein